VKTDVIVFSGGKLADSLSAVSDWTRSANFPGKGRGVVEVSLSPFWADRNALSVVANDQAGTKRAVDRLIEIVGAGGKVAERAPFAPATAAAASQQTTGTTRVAIETPLKGFVPPALVLGLAAAPDGSAVVQLKGVTVLVSKEGKAAAASAFGTPPQVVNGGEVFGGKVEITARHPAWHFPIAWKVSVRSLRAKDPAAEAASPLKVSEFEVPQAFEAAGDRFDGWDRGFVPSPDGKRYFAARDGGGFFLFDLPTKTVTAIDDPARQIGFYEAVRVPISVTAARFSPDGGVIAYTVGNHPSGYGGMMGPPAYPFATALRVADAKSGKTLWVAQAETQNDSAYSAAGDCLAVSDGGRRVAMIDWDHFASLFDDNGRRIARVAIFDWKPKYPWNNNPKPMRCELSRDGKTALFVSDGHVLVTDDLGQRLAAFDVPALADARLSADGASVFTADQDGLVTAFGRAGAKRWTLQTHGERPKLAATDAALLVAEGTGNLLRVDAGGKVVRTVAVAGLMAPADERVEPIAITTPATYREPRTLGVLRDIGAAKEIKTWAPTGPSREAYGRNFYVATGGVTLDVPGKGPRLVHLVYRHTAKLVAVTLNGGDRPLSFVLDLPTPEYRVVDLPCEAKASLTVSVGDAAGLEIAELSVYSLNWPGVNSLYVRPAGAESEASELGVRKTSRPAGGGKDDLLLDDKDPAAVTKSASGAMKNAAIFANNSDPDQVEGHYIRATGNALDNFDGLKFADGKPSAWTKSKVGPFGSRLLVDLNRTAKPKVCATYERTLRQSEVMRGIAVLKGRRADFATTPGDNGPDRLARERRVVAARVDNDQFFNVFDTRGVEMDALGVYVFPREGKDLGLSEVELYE
jgi:hypothetical protein